MYDLHHGHIMHKHNITTPPLVDLTLAWLVHKHDEINCWSITLKHISSSFILLKISENIIYIFMENQAKPHDMSRYDPSLDMTRLSSVATLQQKVTIIKKNF